MGLHNILVITIIGIIILIQFNIFTKTKKGIQLLKTIFPSDSNMVLAIHKENKTIVNKGDYNQYLKETKDIFDSIKKYENQLQYATNDEEYEVIKTEIDSLRRRTVALKNFESDNSCRNTIVNSINNYLIKNKNTTSDFNLIKDIVDRNVDSLEQEVHSQIPIPLYLGLVGTMAGIIIGIGYLAFSGSLSALINSTESSNVGEGINALFSGVALAMIASICGIILTTYSTWIVKGATRENEENKHNFLSWMQAELLPVISNDAITALGRMTDNLNQFNSTFSKNANDLTNSLKLVKETSVEQANLLTTLQNIDVKKMATANALVYEKLSASTLQIEKLADYISNINTYLSEVRQLTEKINDAQARTQLIEEMATYFKGERANLDKISSVVSHSIGEADNQLQSSVANFKQSLSDQYGALIKHADEERQRFEKVADQQQETLSKKVTQLDTLEKEIKNLSNIKSGIENFEKSIEKQNRKIEDLTEAIKVLASSKTGGTSLLLLPEPIKIAAIVAVSIIVLFCLFGLISSIVNFYHYIFGF